MTDTPNLPHAKILVFDSGVGGLSILAQIRRRLPHCNYVYACDNQAFPYGTKAEEELVQRVDEVLKALISRIAPDIVVIACNTASTVALPKIRAHFLKPVVGVVPAIKPAAQLSATKVIGLLATPGTIARPYTQWLIDEFAADCTIVPVGSSELVAIAEEKLRGTAPDPQRLRAILAPIFANPDTDTLVLACTHFPLLREELEAAAPRPVQWVDSGEAIARRVASFTGEHLAGENPDHILEADSLVKDKSGFPCWLTATNQALAAGLKTFGAAAVNIIEIPPSRPYE